MFVGRTRELSILEEAHASPRGELVVLYGRRRIGKSSLVHQFARNKPRMLTLEGLEGERTRGQIQHFLDSLARLVDEPLLASAPFAGWEAVFTYLTERIIGPRSSHEKQILFLDEVQWMAAGRSRLISLLKYYWDNYWKDMGVMLILCGSIASFMIQKVIRSKALYGRITVEILLKGLRPDEASLLFENRRSKEEILKYLCIFGGVPKYLEDIRLNRSFNQNMNRLCFSPSAVMTTEIERIFYNQFREHQTYLKIVHLLKDGLFSLGQTSQRLGMTSGGGLRRYLKIMEDAEIIRSFLPFDRGGSSKLRRYSLVDEYLVFYFKFIEPNLRLIRETDSPKLFERLTGDSMRPWLGLAFERFCLKHADHLARIMGFGDEVLLAAPFFGRSDGRFQIDLMYRRADKVIMICEIKHQDSPVGTKIIPEMERKCSLFRMPRGHTCEKALISLYGPSDALRDAAYFSHHVVLDDIIPSLDA